MDVGTVAACVVVDVAATHDATCAACGVWAAYVDVAGLKLAHLMFLLAVPVISM